MTTDINGYQESYDLPPMGEGISDFDALDQDLENQYGAQFDQADQFAASQAESAEYADMSAERMTIRDRIGDLATRGQVMREGARDRFNSFTENHPYLATAGGALVDAAVGMASDKAQKSFGSEDVRAASPQGAEAASRWTKQGEDYIAERNYTKAQQRGVGHTVLRQMVKSGAIAGVSLAMKRL